MSLICGNRRGLCFLLIIVLCGCAGARSQITAKTIKYPVSLSQGLYNRDSEIINAKDVEIVHHFRHEWKNWNILFSIIPLNRTARDLSEMLRKEIEEHGGNAIINLRINATLGSWFLQAFVPILPTSVRIVVDGDVVKMSNKDL